MCGGNKPSSSSNISATGRSPYVWGKHIKPKILEARLGSIPIRVGETLLLLPRREFRLVDPHAYGGNAHSFGLDASVQGRSPCVWGKHDSGLDDGACRGSIPMRMGETGLLRRVGTGSAVDPHAYGGNDHVGGFARHVGTAQGRSPCVWGETYSAKIL